MGRLNTDSSLISHVSDGGSRQLRPPPGAALPHLPDPSRPALPPGQTHQPEPEEGGDPSAESRAAALRYSIRHSQHIQSKTASAQSLQGHELTMIRQTLKTLHS